MTQTQTPKLEVVVCKTDKYDLVIRSGPTDAAVRKFVKEHHRRFKAGEPGGPDQSSAREIKSAARYPSEPEYLAGVKGEPVKIEDIISG